MNSRHLTGMKIVITGACGDLGSAISRKLFDCGAHLVLWDIDKEGLNRVSNDLGDTCHVDQVDITDPDSVSNASEYVETKFGGLDILINNAGILPPYGPTWASPQSNFGKCMMSISWEPFFVYVPLYPSFREVKKIMVKLELLIWLHIWDVNLKVLTRLMPPPRQD